MSFKKAKLSQAGQAIVEYAVTFTVLAAGVLALFSAFAPVQKSDLVTHDNFFNNLKITSAFEKAVDTAIQRLNQ